MLRLNRFTLFLLLATQPVFVGATAEAANVLLITAGSSLTSQESIRKTTIEGWGHTVTTIEDGDSQADIDAAMASVDVVYIPEEASAFSLTYKIRLATVGVVCEERLLDNEMGFATSDGADWDGTTVTVTDNTHPITSGFSLGSLTLTSSTQELCYTQGTEAPGAQALISASGAYDLAVLEVGATLANTYSGNSTALGRRVRLPWGGDTFSAGALTSDGRLIAERAVEWAASGGGSAELVGHWRLDETSGVTAADSSGNGHDGTINGSPTLGGQGPYGYAADFATSSDYVEIPRSTKLDAIGVGDSDFSVAFWVKPGAPTGWRVLFFKGGSSPEREPGVWLRSTTNQIHYRTSTTSSNNEGGNSTAELATDQWSHVAVVKNGSSYKCYINGVLDSEVTLSGSTDGNAEPVFLGSPPFDTGATGALMDDVRLYSGSLTDAEVTALYGLVGHWRLDESSGSDVADSSAQGNDGTLNGTAAWTNALRGRGHDFTLSGGDNYIEIPNSDSLENVQEGSYTLAAWYRPDSVPTGSGSTNTAHQSIVTKQGYHLGLRYTFNQQFALNHYLADTSWAGTGTWSNSYSPGRWYHVVGVLEQAAGEAKIYVNGELVNTGTFTAGSAAHEYGTNLWRIGIANPGASTWRWAADGAIDDVRIYSRALNDFEIAELYGLVGHYKLDETSGTVAADSSGADNDGTHTDGPSVGVSAVRSGGVTYNSVDSNDRTDLPNTLLDGKSTYSLAWWVKSESTGVQTILSGANSSTSNAALIVFNDDDTLECQVNGSARFYSVDSIATDRWNHFVYQHDRITGIEKVYMNGQLVGSTTRTGTNDPFEIDSGGLMLGQEQDSVGGGFDTSQALYGSLDDVRIYDRLLDETEVAEIYGLVGHWKLDETSGTIAADSTPFGNDGTLLGGASPTNSDGFQGVDLDGYDDYVSLGNPDHLNFEGDITLSAWFRFRTNVKSQSNIVAHGYTLSPDREVTLRMQSSGVYNVGSWSPGEQATYTIPAGDVDTWVHLVGTFDGVDWRLYRNGTLVATEAGANGAVLVDENWAIGARGDGDPQRSLDGVVRDVRIYNRAVQPEEVAELYGLIGHWKFDESSGVVASDSSGMGNDATFYTGDPTWVSGRTDGAIEFDGGDDARTDRIFDPPATGAVSFWFRPQNNFSSNERLFGLGGNWEVRADSYGFLVCDLSADGVYNFETDDYASSAASWHHIVAMFDDDANTFELYGDGVLLESGSLSIAKQSANFLSFGTRTGSSDRFTGALDDVRIYNRWLTADEISEQSGATSSASGVRIMQWVEVR